jgi:hypothetical protein
MEIRERPPSMLKKMSMVVTWEVPELEIQERPASTLKMSTTDPLRDAEAGDPRAPTINAKKRRWRDPWRVLMEIRQHPPSTLKNVDGGPPRRCRSCISEIAHHQRKKCRQRAPWPSQGGRGPVPIRDPRGVL